MRRLVQLWKRTEPETIRLDEPRLDVERLAAETEQRLNSLRSVAAEQREAARDLIRALNRALADIDAAWGDFDERLGGAEDRRGRDSLSL